jgi:hypothetical protein
VPTGRAAEADRLSPLRYETFGERSPTAADSNA